MVDASVILKFNDQLHDHLRRCKDSISEYHNTREWDFFKRFTNSHELIYTSSSEYPSIASYSPVSRSFFKLWEILHDFHDKIFTTTVGRGRFAFLADGPGGFIEAFCRYCSTMGCLTAADVEGVHGITLLSKNRNVPHWKIPARVMNDYKVTLHSGADGTGNLYHLPNIDHFVESIGEASCKLVTADGGFDFTRNFNNQERMSLGLVACEIYTALRLQAVGGAFLIKLYDIRMPQTLALIAALKPCYSSMSLIKPITSRPANSEKYLLCSGFKRHTPELLATLRQQISEDNFSVPIFSWRDKGDTLLTSVAGFNFRYVLRQISCIKATLALIQGKKNPDASSIPQLLCNQILQCITWCHAYRVPMSSAALAHYMNVLMTLKSGVDVISAPPAQSSASSAGRTQASRG